MLKLNDIAIFMRKERMKSGAISFDKKEVSDWTIEGPRKFEKDSVINQNKYYGKTDSVVIDTEKGILQGRDIDRKKISMSEIEYNEKIDGNPVNSKKNG